MEFSMKHGEEITIDRQGGRGGRRHNDRGWGLPAMALLLFLTACAATTLKAVWQNPDFADRTLRKVLVVSVCKQEAYRRIFEDSLSQQLQSRGVTSQPGYAIFAEKGQVEKRNITSEVAARGFDALIITKVTGKETRQVIHPGGWYPMDGFYDPPMYYRSWYPYYARSFDYIHESGYVEEYKVVTVESNVYDTDSDELIWSGVSETVVEGDVKELILSLSNKLTQALAGAGLIADREER